ncbi:hypothetical protein LCGC14_1037710 [marine sediment metagenome]|uniref:Uncharacterized protein n=1 Tax=marine sediment metagenome TaxID=412755 RepID=A0A0F9QYX0_9ZZZZ
MSTINPIIESPKHPKAHPLEVPQYVLDSRQDTPQKSVIPSDEQINKAKAPKRAKCTNKAIRSSKITPEQFNSFIDQSYGNPSGVQNPGIKPQYWRQLRSVAERTMKKLRYILKYVPKEEQIVLNELIELKKKELEVIFNYIKRR